MYKKAKNILHNEKVYKFMNNGWRFALVPKTEIPTPDNIQRPFRYELEAKRHLTFSQKIIKIESLLV